MDWLASMSKTDSIPHISTKRCPCFCKSIHNSAVKRSLVSVLSKYGTEHKITFAIILWSESVARSKHTVLIKLTLVRNTAIPACYAILILFSPFNPFIYF